MKYGGHETFAIREGWLHKGLALLVEEPDKLFDEHSADWLGVGRNMAKSIRYWLQATGLAHPSAEGASGFEPSETGRVTWSNDRYFEDQGTWWALHVNLVLSPQYGRAWSWFFNRFNSARFDRATCLEALKRYVVAIESRPASPNTLQRDVACLLQSYAKDFPPSQTDPEDAHTCPFVQLGLLSHFRESAHYRINRSAKDVPPEILCFAIERRFGDGENRKLEVSFADLIREDGAPARLFSLEPDALFDLAGVAERRGYLEIIGQAGNRAIRVDVIGEETQGSSRWLTNLHERVRREEARENVA